MTSYTKGRVGSFAVAAWARLWIISTSVDHISANTGPIQVTKVCNDTYSLSSFHWCPYFVLIHPLELSFWAISSNLAETSPLCLFGHLSHSLSTSTPIIQASGTPFSTQWSFSSFLLGCFHLFTAIGVVFSSLFCFFLDEFCSWPSLGQSFILQVQCLHLCFFVDFLHNKRAFIWWRAGPFNPFSAWVRALWLHSIFEFFMMDTVFIG